MKARPRDRSGAVLLEALVGLVLLGLVASGAAWTSAEMLAAVDRTEHREAEVRSASRLLTAVSLWPTDDLDRHLGESLQGDVRLLVERPRATLYRVRIVDATASVLLETWLYREVSWAR